MKSNQNSKYLKLRGWHRDPLHADRWERSLKVVIEGKVDILTENEPESEALKKQIREDANASRSD